jgi:hypothetical protein
MNRIPRIYIAGPFTAKTRWEEEQNVRQAEALGYEVAKLGAYPVISHTNTRPLFIDLQTPEWWYIATLESMFTCDAVLLTKDWRMSTGARNEKEQAEKHGIPVFESIPGLYRWLTSRSTIAEGERTENERLRRYCTGYIRREEPHDHFSGEWDIRWKECPQMEECSRIAALESSLAERERECDRLRGELAGSDVNVRELWARAESAESALAAARAENERLRVEMEQHMQVAASRCSRLLDTETALEAAREENEQLEEVITSTAVALGVDKVETNDPHCLANEIAHQLAALRADLENKLAAARADAVREFAAEYNQEITARSADGFTRVRPLTEWAEAFIGAER